MNYLILAIVFYNGASHAWERRGHDIVNQTAAYLISEMDSVSTDTRAIFRSQAMALGYYGNVPDIVWKRPKTYAIESNNHFMDLEIFDRAFRAAGLKNPLDALTLPREEFDKKFPMIDQKAGRAFWRISEMLERLQKISQQLRASDPKDKEQILKHQKLQSDFLVMAGTVGHYIADLSMPLHVSENYDGQHTHQKGVHSFFEGTMVDELGPELHGAVMRRARADWRKFIYQKKSDFQLISELAEDSAKGVGPLLAADKKFRRMARSDAAKHFQPMLEQRLARGSLTLAAIWKNYGGFRYLSERFYEFEPEPAFIEPGSLKK